MTQNQFETVAMAKAGDVGGLFYCFTLGRGRRRTNFGTIKTV